jgi:hypothetical protein
MNAVEVVSKARSFMRKVAKADQRAGELRKRAEDLEREMDFLPSVGVAKTGEVGRAKGVHASPVEAIADKREKMEHQHAALLREAEEALEERATVSHVLDRLGWGLERERMDVLRGRYFQGMNWEQVARYVRLPLSRCKKNEQEGLLSLASVLWGMQAEGIVYDKNGLYSMTEEQLNRWIKRWE